MTTDTRVGYATALRDAIWASLTDVERASEAAILAVHGRSEKWWERTAFAADIPYPHGLIVRDLAVVGLECFAHRERERQTAARSKFPCDEEWCDDGYIEDLVLRPGSMISPPELVPTGRLSTCDRCHGTGILPCVYCGERYASEVLGGDKVCADCADAEKKERAS